MRDKGIVYRLRYVFWSDYRRFLLVFLCVFRFYIFFFLLYVLFCGFCIGFVIVGFIVVLF